MATRVSSIIGVLVFLKKQKTNIKNKLRPQTQKMLLQMSLYTNSVYRHNMYQINDTFSDSKQAHGNNLVSDYYHYERIYNNQLKSILL